MGPGAHPRATPPNSAPTGRGLPHAAHIAVMFCCEPDVAGRPRCIARCVCMCVWRTVSTAPLQVDYLKGLGASPGLASVASSAMPFAGVFSILLTGVCVCECVCECV